MTSGADKHLLAFDPGRNKCGIAVLRFDGSIVEKTVISRADLQKATVDFIGRYRPDSVAVGDGTGSDEVGKTVESLAPGTVMRIGEKGTTLEARDLAWRLNPPGGIWQVIPKLFWPMPSDLDAWAAVVIGRRALEILEIR